MFSRHETAILKGFHRTDIPSLVVGVEMGTYGYTEEERFQNCRILMCGLYSRGYGLCRGIPFRH